MKTRITGEYAKGRSSYNVYCSFVSQNHKMLYRRAVQNPAFLIAVLLVAFALVGTIDHTVAVMEAGR